MKRLGIILVTLLLFWGAYQVRSGYVATRDYNEPSDWKEYPQSLPGVRGLFAGFRQPEWVIKHNITDLNIHGTPLYMLYAMLLSRYGLTPAMAAPVIHAGFVVLLFLVGQMLLPFGAAVLVAAAAALYTPLFAFIYSWMPETFTAVAIPTFAMAASMIVTKAKKPWLYGLAGFLVFLIGGSRHVFAYYGAAFILLWLLATPRRPGSQAWALIAGYLLPTLVWNAILQWTSQAVYVPGTIQSSFMVEHRLATDGWGLDAIKGLTWWDAFFRVIVYQNPFALLLLELERVGRFLKTAANSYSTSFPLSQDALQLLHTLILFFAAAGLRRALKHKTVLFLASLIVWNTLFVVLYYVEEIRYQLPVAGLVLVLAGAGVWEITALLKNGKTRLSAVAPVALFLFWVFMGKQMIGWELWLVPLIRDASVWRWINIGAATLLIAYCTMKLHASDANQKLAIARPWMKRVYTLLPLAIYMIVLAPALRSRTWHEFAAPLRQGERIEQEIVIAREVTGKLIGLNGYVLVDLQDPNAAEFLRMTLNGNELTDRLALSKRVSPVDLMAVRQWQRTMPRLGGYGHVEEEAASAATWPDLHEWLVIPIDGNDIKEENIITVENNNLLSSQPAGVYGDYTPYDRHFYEGPTARIFQGNRTHNKYQVEGDMRLTERRALKSLQNKSTLVNGRGEHIDDLSTIPGKQSGRYRIFFLFPFTTPFPEDIF